VHSLSFLFEFCRRLLVDRGAVYSGRTPLHCAAASGHFAAVEALLRVGAQSHIRDRYGQLACDLALQANHETIFALFGSREPAAPAAAAAASADDVALSSPSLTVSSPLQRGPSPFQRGSSAGSGNFSGGSIRSPRKTAVSIKGRVSFFQLRHHARVYFGYRL
jgi:hypothetical protein